jgi:hypothetical protein
MISMIRYVLIIGLLFSGYLAQAQRLISQEEAVNLAFNNQRNLRAANLSVQQQQQLVNGAAGLSNPQVFGEITPYEPLLLGFTPWRTANVQPSGSLSQE